MLPLVGNIRMLVAALSPISERGALDFARAFPMSVARMPTGGWELLAGWRTFQVLESRARLVPVPAIEIPRPDDPQAWALAITDIVIGSAIGRFDSAVRSRIADLFEQCRDLEGGRPILTAQFPDLATRNQIEDWLRIDRAQRSRARKHAKVAAGISGAGETSAES